MRNTRNAELGIQIIRGRIVSLRGLEQRNSSATTLQRGYMGTPREGMTIGAAIRYWGRKLEALKKIVS